MGGLRRLEYRGYDSAGVAIVDDDGVLETAKRAGKLAGARRRPRGDARCTGAAPASATRAGRPTAAPPTGNAHPHLGDDGRLALIHNGIIENFSELKDELLAEGYIVRERDRHRGRRRAARPRVPSRRRAHRGVPRHRVAPRRRVHPARRAPRPARRRRRRPPQLAARHRPRRRRELPRLGCRRVRRVHEARRGDRPGPDRHDHRRRRHASPTSPATPSRSSRSTSRGTRPPPRRAAGPRSCARRCPSSPRRSRTPCAVA